VKLSLQGVCVEIDTMPIVTQADLEVGPGEIVGLVGPNGSGKTTLLRAIYRSIRLSAGTILLDGRDHATVRQKDIARQAALVAQESGSDFDFCVEDVVALGRVPHQRSFDRESEADRRAIAGALERTGMTAYRDRAFATLSGGEKQRVLLARALAQQTTLLLLDEPTNHLDISAALDLLELVRATNLSTLCVLHDLNLAAAYCDRLCVLSDGRIVAAGSPATVLTEDLVRDVFGVTARRLRHPATGRLLLAFSPPPSETAPSTIADVASRAERTPGNRPDGTRLDAPSANGRI
jgi:iron complex transport system ATP-binding protein